MNESSASPAVATKSTTPLLSVRDLQVAFRTADGFVPAVRGVSFDVYPGETIAIVGESGSGKSTTAMAINRLLPENGIITAGSITFEGVELTTLKRRQIEEIRGKKIGMVPQDPMNSLNHVWNIGFQVDETIRANGLAKSRAAVKRRTIQVLKEAGLSDAAGRVKQFPHEFSGGMRQRVLIGISLAANPSLLLADEPTSALDVTVQKRVLDHLDTLTTDRGTAVVFITHDLGLAAERTEHLIVMHRGKIVESGPSLEVLRNPQHPYTQRLMAAAPSLSSARMRSAHTQLRAAEPVADTQPESTPVIEFSEVTKIFQIRTGTPKKIPLTAVDNVSFQVTKGTTTALVGESGSGKSTAAKLLLKLTPITSGKILIDGNDISTLKGTALLALRRRMQPVFQDPYGSLDPMRNVGSTISEPLRIHKIGDKAARRARVREVLDQVALPTSVLTRYQNELSGGQRQRVAIARALALKPDIVVLDEAVSALDVLVQAQVLELLNDLQAELGLTYLFITHDLAVVRVIADHVVVMEQGKVVEAESVDNVFSSPKTEYTRMLLDAIPGAGLL
ncbi:MAG: ABC transporter ATP-binding protein [Propionibacteriaceae bacterium]|nr:ABC transporter ATP-binding protein [Propionibacteriaceae bacterium]